MLSERFARALEYLQIESRLVPERLALLDALEIQLATTFPPSFKAWYAQEHEGRPLEWGYGFITVAAEDFPDWIYQAEGKRFLCLWCDDHGSRRAVMPLDDPAKQIYIGHEDDIKELAELKLKNLTFEDFMICNLVEYLEASFLWPALHYRLSEQNLFPLEHDLESGSESIVIKNFENLFGGYDAGTFTILPKLVRLVIDGNDVTKNLQVRFLGNRPAEKDGKPIAAPNRLERMSEMLGFSLEAEPQYQAALDQLPEDIKLRLPERVQFWYSRKHGGFPVPWHQPGFGLPVEEFTEKWGIENRTKHINHIRSDFALLLWRNLGDTQIWKLSLFHWEQVELYDRDVEFHVISRANTFEDFMVSRIFNWIIRSSNWVINHTSQEIAPENVETLFASEASQADQNGAILATLLNKLGERYFPYSRHHEYFLLTAHSLRRIRRLAGPEERYLLETAELSQSAAHPDKPE